MYNFFKAHEKTFYAATGSRENKVHINLQELRERFRELPHLMEASEDSTALKNFLMLNLLVSVTPRGEMFMGKHGAGLMTEAEFIKILDEAHASK